MLVHRKVFQVVSHTKLEYLMLNVFSTFYGLILADSKSGEILMPNDLIALGFSSIYTLGKNLNQIHTY